MIAKRKRILCFIMLALAFACVFAVSAFANDSANPITEADVTDGLSFTGTEGLHVSQAITKMPRTYEAVVYLGEDAPSTEGTIFGNYVNLENPHINFSLDSTGKPKIYVHDTYTRAERQTTFNMGKTVKGKGWTHIVITHEKNDSGDIFKCYINGVLEETKTSSYTYDMDLSDMQKLQFVSSFYVGQDFRPNTDNYFFKGRIKDVAVYSEPLSAEDVLKSYNNGIDIKNDNLMLCYNLTAESAGRNTEDKSGNGYTLKPIYHERDYEFDSSKYAYSFAVLGDTQNLVEYDVANGTDYASHIYDWITSNKDAKKIARVLGVGDITESNIEAEWNYAVAQYKKLEDENIPYTITWGYSHDGLHGEEFTKAFINSDNFKNSSIEYQSGYNSATALANYYQTFRAGATDYMILSLGWAERLSSEVLNWASGAIKAHPDHKVIILTHYYIDLDGSVSEAANNIWENLVANNSNVIMTLSGHIQYPANIARSTVVGNSGQTVNQFLINPQYMDKKYGYDQTSFVTMFYFSEDGSEVDVEYISTIKSNQANNDVLYSGLNEFSFTVPEPMHTVETQYGTIPNEYLNAEKYPFVIFDQNKNFIDAAPYLLGANKQDSAIGIAKDYLKENAWNKANKCYVGPDGKEPLSVYILMRRSVVMDEGEYYNNLSQIQGTVTLDLSENMLTTPEEKPLFNTSLKAWNDSGDEAIFPSEITIKNGKINTLSRELIQLEVNANGNDKIFKYNFEDVEFKVLGSSACFAVQHKSSSKGTSVTPTQINFTDCVIDISAAPSNITIFHLSDYTTKASVCVKGGKILTGGVEYNLYVDKNNAGSLRFEGNSSEEYTRIISGADASAVTSDKFNDGTLSFKKLSEENGEITYAPVVTVSCGEVSCDIPSEYLSSEKYPFVIFNSNGEWVGAAQLFMGEKSSDSAIGKAKTELKKNIWDSANETYGDEEISVIILMRRDVAMESNEYFSDISQVQGKLIVDLGEFTLSAPTAKCLFDTVIKAWTASGDASVFPSEVIMKNGSINLFNRELLQFSVMENGVDKKFTYRFENVTFNALGTTTNFASKHKDHTSQVTSKVPVSVIFDDCTFDLTKSTIDASKTLSLFVVTNSNKYTSINFEFLGGSINAGNTKIKLVSGSANIYGGKLTFGKGEERYTTLYSSNTSFAGTTVNGGELTFVNSGTTSDYILYPTVMLGYKIKSSVTLYSNFVYNIYVPKTDALEAITLNGNVVELTDEMLVDIDGSPYYHIAVSLPIAESVNNIALAVTLKSGTSSVDAKWTLNVVNYAKNVLNAGNDVEKTVVRDMLSYAKAAYTYFNGTGLVDEADYNKAKALIESVIGADYDANNAPVMAETAVNTTGAEITNATISLGKKLTFTFIVADGYNANDFVFKMGGAELETVVNGNTVTVSTYGYAVRNTVEYTVNGTDIKGSYNLKYYYDGADSSVQALLRGLWKYSESAEAYKASVTK